MILSDAFLKNECAFNDTSFYCNLKHYFEAGVVVHSETSVFAQADVTKRALRMPYFDNEDPPALKCNLLVQLAI